MGEGDNPKVVRLPRNVDARDASGKPLRKEGPCYICDQPTEYRYAGLHVRYGDAWLDKHFRPAVRPSQVATLRSGIFLRQHWAGKNTLLRLLKFVCRQCLDEMEHRLWPEAEARERAEAERRNAIAWDLSEQRSDPRHENRIRLVAVSDQEIEFRIGDDTIGTADYDARTSRLRVILGDAYPGTAIPHVWNGGPAAVEIAPEPGIRELLGPER